jgi:hypothetical protein
MVLVPQHKLDAIEEARLKLYDLLKPQMKAGSVQDAAKFSFLVALQEITQPMWEVANTKWENAEK